MPASMMGSGETMWAAPFSEGRGILGMCSVFTFS